VFVKSCQAVREKARGGVAGCLLSRTAMPPAGVRAHSTHWPLADE
jgi:hypothetical protein